VRDRPRRLDCLKTQGPGETGPCDAATRPCSSPARPQQTCRTARRRRSSCCR
jgi:hypothetical protein